MWCTCCAMLHSSEKHHFIVCFVFFSLLDGEIVATHRQHTTERRECVKNAKVNLGIVLL